jgi:hypothetical protein
VHGALDYRVWRVGVQNVEDRMNYFIALGQLAFVITGPTAEAPE